MFAGGLQWVLVVISNQMFTLFDRLEVEVKIEPTNIMINMYCGIGFCIPFKR